MVWHYSSLVHDHLCANVFQQSLPLIDLFCHLTLVIHLSVALLLSVAQLFLLKAFYVRLNTCTNNLHLVLLALAGLCSHLHLLVKASLYLSLFFLAVLFALLSILLCLLLKLVLASAFNKRRFSCVDGLKLITD